MQPIEASSKDTPASVPLSHGTPAASLPAASPDPARDLTAVPPPKPRTRKPKAPKDSKIYKTVMGIIALRAQGMTRDEAATQLGISKHTAQVYLHRAQEKGWLNIESFSDPEDRLDIVLRSKAVRNINTVLDETNDDGSLSLRASNVALEVAKGTGLLKQHQVVKGDAGASMFMALKVQVEMPPSERGAVVVREGTVGGARARGVPVDAEIMGSED